MYRSSPRSRSHRSKGFKVKHALQICLLLGLCIWLLYQVGHPHNNKSDYEESVKTGSGIIKLGRKDLRPRLDPESKVDREEQEDESRNEEEKPDDGMVTGGVLDQISHDRFHDKPEEDSVYGEKEGEDKKEESAESREDSVDGRKENEVGKEVFGEETTERKYEGDNVNEEREKEEGKDKFSEEKEMGDSKEENGEEKENSDAIEMRNKESGENESEEKGTETGDRENQESNKEDASEVNENLEEKQDNEIDEVLEENKETGDVEMKTEENKDKIEHDENDKLNEEEGSEEHSMGDDASGTSVAHETQNGEDQDDLMRSNEGEQVDTNGGIGADPNQSAVEDLKETEQVEKNDASINAETAEEGGKGNGKQESDHGPSETATEATELDKQQQVEDSDSISASEENQDASLQKEVSDSAVIKEESTIATGHVVEQNEKSSDAAGSQQWDLNTDQQSDFDATLSAAFQNGVLANSESVYPGFVPNDEQADDSSMPSSGSKNNGAIQRDNSIGSSEGEDNQVLLSSNASDNKNAEQKEGDSRVSREKGLTSSTSNDSDSSNSDGNTVAEQKEQSDYWNFQDKVFTTNNETDSGPEQYVGALNSQENEMVSNSNINDDDSDADHNQKENSTSGNTENESNANNSGNAEQNGRVDTTDGGHNEDKKDVQIDTNGNTDTSQEDQIDSSDSSSSQGERDSSSNTSDNPVVSQNESIGSSRNDSIDSQEEKKVPTDFETLPESLDEGSDRGAAAE